MLLEHAPDHVRCKRRSHEIVIPSPSGLLQLPVWVGMERCLFQPALIAGVEGPMFQAPDPHQSLGGGQEQRWESMGQTGWRGRLGRGPGGAGGWRLAGLSPL